MSGTKNFVPVHPQHVVDPPDPLVDLLAQGGEAQEILHKLTDGEFKDADLIRLAEQQPALAGRVLMLAITARREALMSMALAAGWSATGVQPPGAPEVHAQPRLLLVEDDHEFRRTLSQYLDLQGFEVRQAKNGQEALAQFRKQTPDLVLSDVYMPRMNGFKLMMEIKSQAPDLPMLLMTGSNSVGQVFETFKYSNVGFLSKPFRMSELGERIQSMLGVTR